jgi:hypothetical protein
MNYINKFTEIPVLVITFDCTNNTKDRYGERMVIYTGRDTDNKVKLFTMDYDGFMVKYKRNV